MLELRIGDNNIRVDTENIKASPITYSLADIKNYGGRNLSHSKQIRIKSTSQTERVFEGLFHMNVINGYTVSNLVDAELLEDGISILRGSVQVINSAQDEYYDVIVSSAGFNLFNEIGDKLIVGNVDPSDDIIFDDGDYAHDYTRDFVRGELNRDPSNDGAGFMYGIVNYDNHLDTVFDLIPDYFVAPALNAKAIFDAIFDKYGYTYKLSSDISTYLNTLYCPFNDDINKYTTNWDYCNYQLGTDSKTTVINSGKEIWKQGLPAPYEGEPSDRTIPNKSLQGLEADPSDYILNRNTTYTQTTYGYRIPKRARYDITVNLLFGKNDALTDGADMEAFLTIYRDGIIFNTYELGTADGDIEYPTDDYLTKTLENVDLLTGDYLDIQVRSTAATPESTHRLAVLYDASSAISLTEKNSVFGNDNTFELNDFRPVNYKQSEFIDDIFKIFNAYIEMDKYDNKKLYIDSYNYYFNDVSTLNWTEKIGQKKIGKKSIKNEFPKQIIFTNDSDIDIFNKDFDENHPYPFNFNVITNDSDFATKIKNIKMKSASTILKTIGEDYTPTAPGSPSISSSIELFKFDWQQNEITVPAIGIITAITANVKWAISSNANWITFDPGAGIDDADVTIGVLPNFAEGEEDGKRYGTVTISGQGAVETIAVTQTGNPGL